MWLSNFILLFLIAFLVNICVTNGNVPKSIPGTNLATWTLYELRLRPFQYGTITWTGEGTSDYNNVMVDNNYFWHYQPGWHWYNDALWQLIPALNCGQETGWYALVNRGRPGQYLTWNTQTIYDNSKSFHIVLHKKFPNGGRNNDFLVKPVRFERNYQNYYQLKFRSRQEATVTWADKKYDDREGSNYIQLDDHEYRQQYYAEGGGWFEDTLFSFRDAVGEKIREDEKTVLDIGTNC